jgi:hypothetical protein
MTITFENDNDVIVYALEKVISYAKRTQQIFVAKCVWWLASVIGLDAGLIRHIDILRERESDSLPIRLIRDNQQTSSPDQCPQQGHPDRVSQIFREKSVSEIPRNLTENQRLDRILESAERVIKDSHRDRTKCNPEQDTKVVRDPQRVSITPRDIQEDPRSYTTSEIIHPDRRAQIQVSDDDISNLNIEDSRQGNIVTETREFNYLSKKERKEVIKQRHNNLSRVRLGKVIKPITKKQRKYLQSISKDTITEYFKNRK